MEKKTLRTFEGREEPTVALARREEKLEPGTVYGPIKRDLYILECCTAGGGGISINGTYFPFRAGQCYFLLPGDVIVHYTDPVTARDGVWCAIDGLRIGRALRRAGITSEKPFLPESAFETVRDEIERMISISEKRENGSEYALTACIYRVLAEVVKNAAPPAERVWIDRAIGYMETAYHRPVTVSEIAGYIGFERSYLSVLFKRETGMSPHAYLNALRVRKAEALLSETDTPVSVIAESVGLDPSNFYRTFRRQYGFSPLNYRKKKKGQ